MTPVKEYTTCRVCVLRRRTGSIMTITSWAFQTETLCDNTIVSGVVGLFGPDWELFNWSTE